MTLVSTTRLLVLGAIAGFTIFLGLPMGRIRSPRPGLKAFLNALAIGILTFLLWDVLSNAVEPIETALNRAAVDHTGSWLRFAGLASVFALCLAVGLLSLVYYDRWLASRRPAPRPPTRPFGPGAAAVQELAAPRLLVTSPARRLALFIAVGIGLHNFSEGLAIGQSAAKGEISLAVLLIIGFGLHNATEGFGIVAPFAGEPVLPSWRFLFTMGLIGGGPTFLGTLVGHSFVNDTMFLAFLALAAGSILYVVVQLLHVASKLGHKELLMWGMLLGLLLGFATDFVLVAAGV
jgi:zinc transporter, ZIP family